MLFHCDIKMFNVNIKKVCSESSEFNAKKKFKCYINVVLAINRLKTLRRQQTHIEPLDLIANPYRFKIYRKLIDTAAFNIYGHWVKGEQQNRTALFEVQPKCDLKSLLDSRIEVLNES